MKHENLQIWNCYLKDQIQWTKILVITSDIRHYCQTADHRFYLSQSSLFNYFKGRQLKITSAISFGLKGNQFTWINKYFKLSIVCNKNRRVRRHQHKWLHLLLSIYSMSVLLKVKRNIKKIFPINWWPFLRINIYNFPKIRFEEPHYFSTKERA